VRSHGMASSAGSTLRQASGAPSRSRLPIAALAALVLTALVAMTASVASGAVSTEYLGSFGPDGTEGTDFEHIKSVAVDEQSGSVYVLDRAAGALYKFAADGTPLDWGGTALYVEGNKITGLNVDYESQVAVDSASHVIYVTEKNSLRAFEEDGEAAEFTAGPGAGTDEIPGFDDLNGVAVDVNGSIYTSDSLYPDPSGTVNVYAPSGEPLTSFDLGPSHYLAVASNGTLYMANSYANSLGGGLYEFTPDEFPVTATTDYAAGQTLTTEGTGGVDVDSVSGDVYALRSGYIAKYDSSGAFIRYFGETGGESELLSELSGIAVVGGGEEFQFYVGNFDSVAGTAKVAIFGEEIDPGPPSVVSTSAVDVASTSATLRAEINPNTFATTYRFEYGLGDCAVSVCTSAPLGGAGIGSGHRPVAVSQGITALVPGTTYHYRVVAENSEGVTEGPDHTLTAQLSGLGFRLPDRRAWEMVSPPDKHGGLLIGAILGQTQAAEDGNGLAYLSINSIEEDPEGSRVWEPASALARRGTEGWRSEDIATAHDRVVSLSLGHGAEYKFFSSDLSRGLVHPRGATLLSPQASERTPYLRENIEPGFYVPLVTGKEGFANVPPGTEFGGDPGETFGLIWPQGATSDLDHVVLSSCAGELGCVSLGSGPGLYRWSAGQLHPVSVLPAGEGGETVLGVLGSDVGSIRHAISEDGSRIFWATGGYDVAGIHLTALYLRDTPAEESVRLDLVQPGASGAGEPHPAFQGASADGTVVYFTDSRQLTEDASPGGRDLYRCEIPAGAGTAGCATLTNLSAPLPGSGESAMVKDMSPALSEDGSRIYFVAGGVLDTGANEEGDSAITGEPNLYLYEEGEGVRFIATLSMDGRANWGAVGAPSGGYAAEITASASPSGRYFAFMSERSLTGYDNRDAASDEPTEQVFRYDAASGRLDCVSCNPSGAAPLGQIVGIGSSRAQLIDPNRLWTNQRLAASVPQATTAGITLPSFYRSRTVLDNGRVFFDAIDALVPADSNGEWDVYQWEPTGVGDCTASSGGASTSRSAGGCVSLLSSGTAEEEAAFLDASASGDDVFFLTPARLSVLDKDAELDAYDARVDGVAATLPPDTECLGEACQPAALAPNDPTPASAGFRGQGDPKQSARKRCAKGKRIVHRKGRARCVARKHKRQGRASTKRRASR